MKFLRSTRTFGTSLFKKKIETNQIEEILQLEHFDHRDKFYTTLQVNNQSIQFEVDSGSAVTIMEKEEARKFFKGEIMYKTRLKLVSFCKTWIKVEGYITVNVKYGNSEYKLNIYITLRLSVLRY